MKKIINKRLYDTKTATLLACYDDGLPWTDYCCCYEELYRKKNGEYFIYGTGGAWSPYPETTILPVSPEEAREWAEEKMSVDDYLKYFEIEED